MYKYICGCMYEYIHHHMLTHSVEYLALLEFLCHPNILWKRVDFSKIITN